MEFSVFLGVLKDHHLKCKNDHYICDSHGTPSLIKILLDGHTVTSELI